MITVADVILPGLNGHFAPWRPSISGGILSVVLGLFARSSPHLDELATSHFGGMGDTRSLALLPKHGHGH